MTILPEHAGTPVLCPGCHATVTPALDLPDDAPPPARAKAPTPKPKPADDFDFSEPDPPRRKRRRAADADDEGDDRPRRPWDRRSAQEEPEKWLMGVAALPMALAFIGGLIGGICGGLAAGLNVTVARNRTIPVAGKLFVFALTTAVASVAYFVVAREVLERLNKADDEPKRPAVVQNRDPLAARPNAAPAPPKGPAPKLQSEDRPPVVPAPEQPKGVEKVWEPEFLTLPSSARLRGADNPAGARADDRAGDALRHGRVRLADGPAAPTAGHAFDHLLAVGYADGSTAVWDLDGPLSTPPRRGPKFPGPVGRLWLAGKDRYVVAEVGPKLYVAALAAPHKALAVPAGDRCGVRLCGFGTAAVVQKVGDGYRTRWLVNGVFDESTAVPPPGFDTPFFRAERLARPPAEPLALTWIHTSPLAILADGRVTRWRDDGSAQTFRGTGAPLAAWAVGSPPVALVGLDRRGGVQVRNDVERMDPLASNLTGSGPRLAADAAGHWLCVGEAGGAVAVWEAEPGRPVRMVARVEPNPGEPLRPLCEVRGAFAVATGGGVALWHKEVLRREADAK